ncbi:divergent polysaccharide deacetylase family protein [Candidatus Latescibacterota bacterium]
MHISEKLKRRIIRFLYFFLPLTAVIALGASSYLWYRALKPERIPISEVSPEFFSYTLEGTIRSALAEHGIGKKDISWRDPEGPGDLINRIYTVKVPEKVSLTLLNLSLNKSCKDIGGHVLRGIDSSEGRILNLTLGVGDIPTDIVIFRKIRGLKKHIAKMAIIVDDLGIKSIDLARRLCDLEQVVTLSILPFQKHTSKVLELVEETETPYLLHMPMEPKSNIVNPGEGAIYVTDEEETVKKKLDKAFKSVKGARGLNNHMGSKATENIRVMEYIMNFLRESDYFFVDSKTSRASIGYSFSQKKNVRGIAIHGYIDVNDNRESIEKRLDELVQLAFTKGYAVIICHDKPNTVDVLEKKLPELQKQGIRFVGVSELIH